MSTPEAQVAPSFYETPRKAPAHSRGAYARQSRVNVVRFGYMTEAEADAVFLGAMREWGLSTSSAEERADLLYAIAEAMIVSTSKDEENLDTRFSFNDEYFSLRVLYDKASELTLGKNDSYLRVFARSYNRAQIACIMTDMLSNTTNVSLRQAVARRAECPIENAPYAIDVFDAVIDHSGRNVTSAEIAVYNKLKATRTSNAQSRAADVGLLVTRNDTSNRETPVRNNHSTSAKTDPAARTGFAPVSNVR